MAAKWNGESSYERRHIAADNVGALAVKATARDQVDTKKTAPRGAAA
jgi:hypothetical protein